MDRSLRTTSTANTSSAEDEWVDVSELSLHPKPKYTAHKAAFFYEQLNKAATWRLAEHKSHLFFVEFETKLYDIFVQALPEEDRREFDCTACRKFVNKYGRLALVNDNGELQPLMWYPRDLRVDPYFRDSVQAIFDAFKGRKVSREFKIAVARRYCGKAQTGGFRHMYIGFPAMEKVMTAEKKGLAVATTLELTEMLDRVLKDYDLATIKPATQILEQHKLPYSNNSKAAARWLLDLVREGRIDKASAGSQERRWNLLNRYAASSFVGCLHQLRSGALSTLLDNVKAGKDFEVIKTEWQRIADPLHYMRPQAAPKAGNIAVAERLFAELGLTAEDTRRRFLVLDDVPQEVRIWTGHPSTTKSKPTTGIFAKITPREAKKAINDDLPSTKISFTKLVTKILPNAMKLEYKLDTRNGLYFFTTGLPNTKPLMQWHSDTNRASWYTYALAAHNVEEHPLISKAWNEVTALIPFPHLWDGAPLTTTFPVADENDEAGKRYKYWHKAKGFRYLFVLKDIRDKNAHNLCLFPTLLKSEFHGVRATIERYSREGRKEYVDGVEGKGGYVGGIEVKRGATEMGDVLRVTDREGERGVYEVVAWD